MKVILAETLGFCGGVSKAVNLIYSELDKDNDAEIFMEGPIIHNRSVIEDLESRGVRLLKENSNIIGHKVIVRAHGITPEVQNSIKNRGAEVVDGTCPIVKASQTKIKKFSSIGYFTVIAGDKGHAEVIGLVGQASGNCLVVAKISDIDGNYFPEKTILISQTTFSKSEFFEIEGVLKKKCPTLKTLCTICGATKERQDAVIELAKKVEAIIVVGGITSSNTKRLKIAVENLVPTWLIEDDEGLPEEIKNYSIVGVTGGASTPDNIIKKVVEKLRSY